MAIRKLRSAQSLLTVRQASHAASRAALVGSILQRPAAKYFGISDVPRRTQQAVWVEDVR